MLQLGMDVLFVIWSTTIGKIVSGHSLDPRFFFLFFLFFLSLQVFLFFLLESLYLQRKGGTPLDPVFFSLLLSLLLFSLLLFSFLFSSLCFLLLLEIFCFFDRAFCASWAVHVHSRNSSTGN